MLGYGNTTNNAAAPSSLQAQRMRDANELMSKPRFSQSLKLKSGEQVSFADVGDKQGIPVVWFSGPTYNRLMMALYEEMALANGIRLLCFDRPGRGASTPPSNPKEWEFRSWAVYLDELTNMLRIEKFFVVAHSLGASYALACFEPLRHKIVGALRFLATWAPSNLPCMPTTYALQRSLPRSMLRSMYSLSYSGAVSSISAAPIPTQMGKIGSREQLNSQDLLVHAILERTDLDHRNDAYKAFELDWLLALEIGKPFGFDHRKLDCSVKCWHGMDDSVSPLGAAMWMQREMKHFLLYAVEGATHNILLDFAIVRALFADIAKEAATVLPKQHIGAPSSPASDDGNSSQSGDGKAQVPTPAATPTNA
eukprot:jgi/Hompol1/1282/HPOL_001159-RA